MYLGTHAHVSDAHFQCWYSLLERRCTLFAVGSCCSWQDWLSFCWWCHSAGQSALLTWLPTQAHRLTTWQKNFNQLNSCTCTCMLCTTWKSLTSSGSKLGQVNSTRLDNVLHDEAVQCLKRAGDDVTLVVKYFRPASLFLTQRRSGSNLASDSGANVRVHRLLRCYDVYTSCKLHRGMYM